MPAAATDIADLPLRYQTPPSWASRVLSRPLKLLNDHAHLEKKAAANALELLNRWPGPGDEAGDEGADMTALAVQWSQTMTAVARDEIDHLGIVLRLLLRRGGRLTKSHRNAYAAGLRSLVRIGRGPEELLDRLLVSALIELRSCERFALLGHVCEDDELGALYRDLWASERGHYTVFLNLARQLPHAGDPEARWDDFLDAEAKLIASQPQGVGMHSG